MEKSLKDTRILIMCVGGFHLFSGLMTVMVISFQRKMMAMAVPEARQIFEMAESIQNTIMGYMPYLALIGLMILIFGWQLKRLLAYAVWINLVLTASLIAWIIFSSVPMMEYFTSFTDLSQVPAEMSSLMNSIKYISLVINVIFFITPQVIIFVKLRKLNSPQIEKVVIDKKDF